MNAGDVMTKAVVSVHPDTPVGEIARLLLDNGISAVPVLDNNATPIGIVSEGDLIRRDEAAREARRAWWLEILAEGEQLSPEFLAWLNFSETRRASYHVGACYHRERGYGGRRDSTSARRSSDQAGAGGPRWPPRWHCGP